MRESKDRNRNGAGKGDKYRPVDQKKWDAAWDKFCKAQMKGKVK